MQKPLAPIFILWTRSFWWTVTGLATLLGAGTPVIKAFITIIAAFTSIDVDVWTAWVVEVAPAILWTVAIYERSGGSRPYTINPKAR